MARPHVVDLRTVKSILVEARDQEAEALSPELPPATAIRKLGEVEVEELDGSTTKLSALWQDRPAALVFLRHYG